MSDYIVSWQGNRVPVAAETPDEAARIVVEGMDFDASVIHAVEVSVYQKVLSRHDVVLQRGDQ